jgi:cobalt transporter subunit CbtA
MSIFRNVVFVAALAGLVSAVVMTALQAFTTVPLILQAEVYEQSAAAQEQAATPADPAAAGTEAAPPGHVHDEEAWEPADGFERYAFTVVANVITGIGFALILVAVSEFAGGIANWRRGLFWGLAGFAVFTLAPGLGLPPELPAMPAADLTGRQIWWWGTVLATAAGLAMIAFRRSPVFALLGVALLVAPHVVGAPQPADFETPIPEGLHHQFVVAVTMTNLVFWVVLGAATGYFRSRFTGTSEDLRSSFA